jgi:hypothetical protein
MREEREEGYIVSFYFRTCMLTVGMAFGAVDGALGLRPPVHGPNE